MRSVSVLPWARQQRSRVGDGEDRRFGDLGDGIADTVVRTIENVAESEVEARVGVGFRERGPDRLDQRNGYRQRSVQLSWTMVAVRIPRLRFQGYVPSILVAGCRAVKQLEEWVAEALVAGANRATIRRIIMACTGCYPSEGLLKRVCADLDSAAKAFKERQLAGRYEYLFLDAAWVKDIVGLRAGRVCLLTAIGVTPEGRKEILGFERVGFECAQAWRGFLTRLKERGLNVSALRLVISDEHKGLCAAVEEVLGDVAHQYCWAHRMRNLRDTMGRDGRKQHQRELVDGLGSVFRAPNRRAALVAFRTFKTTWASLYPTVVASVEDDLGHLLAFYDSPQLHWEYIRTSNPIERLFLELRRVRFGAGAFANPVSCDRVVGNLYMRLNTEWAERDIWELRRRRQEMRQATAAAARGPSNKPDEASRYASRA